MASEFAPAAGLDRRSLIKAGAWAAPALFITVAAPAAVASETSNVPADQLRVSSYALNDDNANGTPGPLTWYGGHIGWYNPPAGSPTVAQVAYSVTLTGPAGLSIPLIPSGVATISGGGQATLPTAHYGTQPMPGGLYTVTLTAFGTASSSANAQSSVTLASPPPPPAAPVAASYEVIALGSGNHSVAVTLAGTPGTVVGISVGGWNTVWNPALPSSATIGSTGAVTVSGTARAEQSWGPGGVQITFSSSAVVNPNAFYGISIPTA